MIERKIVVQAKNVSKKYKIGEVEQWALRNINLEVQTGDFLALAGSSGSGKTTMLNLFGCLDTVTEGQVVIDTTDVSTLNDQDLAKLRAEKIGFVFQTFNLIPVLSALENVEYPLLKRSSLTAAQRRQQAESALKQVGLKDFIHRRPAQLSGGQRQRVAIARAIVHNPQLVIADEPTANLDKATAQEILRLMSTLNQQNGVTFVFSTHDPNILELAKRIIHISDGQIIKEKSAGGVA